MTNRETTGLGLGIWHKSSYSGGNDNCLVAAAFDAHVAVRDTKNDENGPAFANQAAWSSFIQAITEGTIR